MNNKRIKSKSNKVIFSRILDIIANIIGLILIVIGGMGAFALFSSVQFKYDGVWFLVICLGGILILLKGKKNRMKANNTISVILDIIANIMGVILIVFGAIGALALSSVWPLVISLGGIIILLRGKKKRIKANNLEKNRIASFEDEVRSEKITDSGAFEHTSESTSNKYADILTKLHELNNNIANEELSVKISRIEQIVANIFKIAEEQKKSDKIDTFISYYLPTTLKLLDKYSQYEKYDTGKNVSDLKKEIETVIDKLVSGFEKQLDILLINDVWDVTSDIDVLETMMIRDGLSNSELEVSC